ncbi:MAG: hydroxymethylbilane synthase [Vicinamibacterales bacterium]
MSDFRLGTRGSPLALYQAHAVATAIAVASGRSCEIVIIKTSGDRLTDVSLAEIGGKRLFVKEIEDALLEGRIDLAVHSSKDMPAVLPDGLDVAATLPREDARDALVLPDGARPVDLDAVLAHLGQHPRIGTSSVRRVAQLNTVFERATFAPIRGNLDTRLRKLDSGDYDAIVLASAGLKRLQYGARISALIPVQACVPAPGQGIIAVEIRADDRGLQEIMASIDDRASHVALDAERALVVTLGGGCQMPIGGHAVVEHETVVLTGLVASLDGARVVRAETRGALSEAKDVGARAARELLAAGAGAILHEVAAGNNVAGGQRA